MTRKPEHTSWLHSYKNIVKALGEYVKENFQTGLDWKANGLNDAEKQLKSNIGKSYESYKTGKNIPKAPGLSHRLSNEGGITSTIVHNVESGANALFDQINKLGDGITSGILYQFKYRFKKS